MLINTSTYTTESVPNKFAKLPTVQINEIKQWATKSNNEYPQYKTNKIKQLNKKYTNYERKKKSHTHTAQTQYPWKRENMEQQSRVEK